MSVDIDKLKSEQGANITYLRHVAAAAASSEGQHLAAEILRACDDIEAYREIVGLVLHGDLTGDDEGRLEALLEAMTWGNG